MNIKFKFAQLKDLVKNNMTVSAYNQVRGPSNVGTINKDGLILDGRKASLKNYKYPVVVDLTQPFSGSFIRHVDKALELMIVKTGKLVKYQRLEGTTGWSSTDGNTYDNTELVVLATPLAIQNFKDKQTRNKIKADYLKENLASTLTYGFELETHKTENMNSSNYKRNKPEGLVENMNKLAATTSGLLELVCRTDWDDDPTLRILKYWKDSAFEGSPQINDKIKKLVVDKAIEDGAAPMKLWFNLPENIEVGQDGSVEGFEFRTTGPQSPQKFGEYAEELFKLKHEVETNCSFHIHVGSTAVKLKTSRAAQQHLINYVLSDSRLPDTVRTRLKAKSKNYCSPLTDGNSKKNSFVRCHPDFKTLEFRCFGNLNTLEEAIACRQIATDAVTDMMSQTDLEVMPEDWNEKVKAAIQNKTGSHLRNYAESAAKLKALEEEFNKRRLEITGA